MQTNDERLLPKGTLYLTDTGMCGSLNSVIGTEKYAPIERFLTGMPRKFEVEKKGKILFNALFFEYGSDRKVTNYSKICLTSGD